MSYNYTQGGPTAPMGGAPAPGPAIGQAGLMDVVNSWITSLTKPAVSTYAAEVPRATQNRLIMSVGIVTVLAMILDLLGGLIFTHHPIAGLLSGLIGTPLGFLVGVAGFYFGARAMKGTGNFMEHAWVWSTIWAPITVLASLVGIVPVLGGLVGLALAIYSFYLYYLSLQAVHRLDGTNAIIAIVIGIVVTVIGALIIGLITGVFLSIFG